MEMVDLLLTATCEPRNTVGAVLMLDTFVCMLNLPPRVPPRYNFFRENEIFVRDQGRAFWNEDIR